MCNTTVHSAIAFGWFLTLGSFLSLNFTLFFFSFSTALFFQMMDERFPIDNGTNMTNHQEDGTHTSVEV